ncbi:F-box only protein 7, partial [Menidia menidia]
MKLRVRINRQTSKLELPSEDPSVTELKDLIQETLVSSHGLSSDVEFRLSLNGSEELTGSSQTLASCGVVSGDLICVLLPNANEGPQEAGQSPGTEDPEGPEDLEDSEVRGQATGAGWKPAKTCGVSPVWFICVAPKDNSRFLRLPGPAPPVASPLAPPPPPPVASPLAPPPMACVWEPMLCGEAEDGRAPPALELLYEAAAPGCPQDAVMVAAHLLMLETGFLPAGGRGGGRGGMPGGWRAAGGAYRLTYVHPLSGGSLASVVALAMGPLLVITATLKVTDAVDSVRSLKLTASGYVTPEWAATAPPTAADAFRGLRKLARLFKDQLAYPLIAAAREAMQLPVAFGLAALPPELLLRVLRLLDARSLLRLSTASQKLQAAAAEPSLWRRLYRHDFTDTDPSRPRDTDWKELYKNAHRSRSDFRRALRHRSLPPFPDRDIFTPVPRPLFPPLPGIIGGEHDQRPVLPRGLLPRPRRDPIGPIADPAGRPRFSFRRPPGGGAPNRRPPGLHLR